MANAEITPWCGMAPASSAKLVAARVGVREERVEDWEQFMQQRILNAIANWYNGQEQPFDIRTGRVRFVGSNYKRHWTADFAHVVVDFWFAHWQWTIGSAIVVIPLVTCSMN